MTCSKIDATYNHAQLTIPNKDFGRSFSQKTKVKNHNTIWFCTVHCVLDLITDTHYTENVQFKNQQDKYQ